MKKTKKMLSFVLSMLLIVTMFPTMAFAKEEAKTWKFGELSLKAGDVLGKDTEIKNDAENREIRILSEKTNPDEITRIADYTSSLVEGRDYGTDFAPLMAGMAAVQAAYTVTDGNDYEEAVSYTHLRAHET